MTTKSREWYKFYLFKPWAFLHLKIERGTGYKSEWKNIGNYLAHFILQLNIPIFLRCEKVKKDIEIQIQIQIFYFEN